MVSKYKRPWISAVVVALALPVTGRAGELAQSQRCEPADRLPACRADAKACLDALKATPGGDPVQLACSAEAACLAGRAPACAPFLQFVAQDGFARNLLAREAEFDAACAAGDRGSCTVVVGLCEARLKRPDAATAPAIKLRMARAAATACVKGLACDKVVAILTAGGAGPTADEESGAALEQACKTGANAAACAWVAKTYGDLGNASDRQARCAAGSARACAVEGAEVKLAGGDADPWLLRACQAGDCASCVLRLRDDKGRLKVAGDHADAVAARGVCAKVCATGRMSACNLSHDLLMSGIGGPRNEAAAVEQRLQMCQLDSKACVPLAQAFVVTATLDRDDQVRAALAKVCATERDHAVRQPACEAPSVRDAVRGERVACASGDQAACVQLGRRLRDHKLHAQAAEVLAGPCERGRTDACSALLQVRYLGIDLPPLAAAAFAQLKASAKKSCDTGDAIGCFEVAQAEEAQGTATARKAMQLLQSACKAGNGAACRMAADLTEGYGRKLPDDPKKAMQLRDAGCKAGDARACIAAGKLADEDSENPASGELSGPFYLRACTLGNAEGCARLAATTPRPAGGDAALDSACKAGVLDACPR